MTKTALLIVGVLLPGVALAHPEHVSGAGVGLLHYVTDPFHVGLAALAIGVALMTRPLLRRHARRRTSR